ncbi:MAG: hypothetical protein KBD12_02470 [Candidatus Pacebacteria bacterium]|nr:hypothetical protein [Candidatus Paceibacterota bacterium]
MVPETCIRINNLVSAYGEKYVLQAILDRDILNLNDLPPEKLAQLEDILEKEAEDLKMMV